MSALCGLSREDLERWTRYHFGLTLEHYPPGRAEALAELLGAHPPGTWDALHAEAAGLLSIPETHFCRHPACFDALRQLLMDLCGQRPAGPVRLWSAGCASGEEAYELAAVGLQCLGPRVDVVATDFSESALARARAATYGAWSLRGVTRSEVPWLVDQPNGEVKVHDSVQQRVTFQLGRLAEPGPPYDVDVAFCRNVLIYFSDEGCGRVLDRIAQALRPEGYLLLAPTDPRPTALQRWTPVTVPGCNAVRVYRPPPTARPARPVEPLNPHVPEGFAALIRKMLDG